MQTQISLLVKGDSLGSMAKTAFSVRKIIERAGVIVEVDGYPFQLKASKEPYLMDVDPGPHEITAKDLREDLKKSSGRTFKMGMGMALGGMTGGVGGMLRGMADGFEASEREERNTEENHLKFSLQEGDIIRLELVADAKGVVKITIMN